MGARNFLMGSGLLYIVLSVYGLIVGVGSAANFLSFNTTDNWAYMILGIVIRRRLAALEALAEDSTNLVIKPREKGAANE